MQELTIPKAILIVVICEIATAIVTFGQELSGIGVALRTEGADFIVAGVLPDSPAAASRSIHPGDRIVAVAEDEGAAVQTKGMGLAQVAGMIRGPTGTAVRITVVPAGKADSESKVVIIVRGTLRINARPEPELSFSWWLLGIGFAIHHPF
jgi:C-terminal processing protease CtpA/Prc